MVMHTCDTDMVAGLCSPTSTESSVSLTQRSKPHKVIGTSSKTHGDGEDAFLYWGEVAEIKNDIETIQKRVSSAATTPTSVTGGGVFAG